MKVILVNTKDIKPYKQNPRGVSEDAVKKLAVSIKKFGFRQPIVVDENNVILVGHTRLLASKQLGLEKVPVHKVDDLSDKLKNAYRIFDNKSAEDTHWDYKLLKLELDKIPMDLKFLTGFEQDELKFINEDDWVADENPIDKHGTNLEGITSVIKIEVEPENKIKTLELTKKILDSNNIKYTIK